MKQLLLLFMISLMFTSCYKIDGPEYYDELDITLTMYDSEFDFKPTKTLVVADSVTLRHDYLTDDEVRQFHRNQGPKIINEIVKQFEDKGYTVLRAKEAMEGDSSFVKTADLFLNPTVMLSKTSGIAYWPGYGWGWGWGYYGYYSTNPNMGLQADNSSNLVVSDRDANYYYPYYPYYPPYWGGTYYEYKTGTIALEMGEGQSVRDYWNWFKDRTEDEIINTPADEFPQIDFVWHAFIEAMISGDDDYDKDRVERGFNEAFEQSYYLDK